jgi:hypothetical protein
MPGHLYDSLLDAKQPLMIWIFSIFENFFEDPLYAGRFVSVLVGLTTLLGIYQLAKKLFSQRVGFIAGLLYTLVPIFAFYDRQALLEAGITCIGIWACYALLTVIQNPPTKNSILLGSLLGIGFFIKSSALLFLLSGSVILFYLMFKNGGTKYVKSYFIALGTFICIDLLLFINPIFWQTFSSNSRYAFSIGELFSFPFLTWFHNVWGLGEIGLLYITPLIFITSIAGIYVLFKKKIKYVYIFLLFFIIALTLELLSVKSQSQRYLVSFLPFLVIPAAYIYDLFWKENALKKGFVLLSLSIPLIISLFLLFNPYEYIQQFSRITNFSENTYIHGQTSGYGINETVQYIKDNSNATQPSMVLFGFNIGNPESAIDVYTQKTNNVLALHMDSKIFEGIDQFDCLTSVYPTFFVTRDDQRLGMEKFFTLVKTSYNPDRKYSVRIYSLKKPCAGKTTSLSDIYQPAMNKMMYMRSGGI